MAEEDELGSGILDRLKVRKVTQGKARDQDVTVVEARNCQMMDQSFGSGDREEIVNFGDIIEGQLPDLVPARM